MSDSTRPDDAPSTQRKDFRVPFDPAVLWRRREIGESIWLLLWCYKRVTREFLTPDGDRIGIILATAHGRGRKGTPVTLQRIADELDCDVRTASRWLRQLCRLGLVRQHRTARGLLLCVLNCRKFLSSKRPPAEHCPDWALPSEPAAAARKTRQKCPITQDRNVRSDRRDRTKMASLKEQKKEIRTCTQHAPSKAPPCVFPHRANTHSSSGMQKLPDDLIVSAPDFNILVHPQTEPGLDDTGLPDWKDWPL
jgi:hypothetical protein